MRTIAHISDLHFGRIREEAEEALLEDLCKMKPSLIAVSGDLTQRALRRQFKRARAYLERLPSPFIVVPGNHDIPLFDITRRFLLPLNRYKHYISKQLNPLYVDNEIAVLGVNTARSFAFENGKIGKRQLRRIESVFAGLPPETVRIVVTHHPFCKPPSVKKYRKVVAGATRALRCFEDCGVDLVLSGHFHLVHALDLRTIYSHLDRSMLHVQAGTAISTRIKTMPNSYNLISVGARSMSIEVREWNRDRFEPARMLTFKRTRKGWGAAKTLSS
jgi:3',5'-cyclic AMP phosphodiesterase CpdA